jgi:putative transposase
LRVLEINEIKTVSEIPTSHPFIERLIGTTRREYLDETLFWNRRDLQKKLDQFSEYYNSARIHYSLDGKTPASKYENIGIEKNNLNNYRWRNFCNGKFSIPVAA